MKVIRTGAKDVRRKLTDGSGTLLVCGYDSDDRFREGELEGGISWSAFQSRRPTVPLDQEIVFYCA